MTVTLMHRSFTYNKKLKSIRFSFFPLLTHLQRTLAEEFQESRPASWSLTTTIIVGEMFGVGALALPSAMARLGWLPGIVVLAMMYAQSLFLSRVFGHLAVTCPSAKVCMRWRLVLSATIPGDLQRELRSISS